MWSSLTRGCGISPILVVSYLNFFQAADESHDRLRHQGLQDGVMDIIFAAENEDQRGSSPRLVARILASQLLLIFRDSW